MDWAARLLLLSLPITIGWVLIETYVLHQQIIGIAIAPTLFGIIFIIIAAAFTTQYFSSKEKKIADIIAGISLTLVGISTIGIEYIVVTETGTGWTFTIIGLSLFAGIVGTLIAAAIQN